MILFAHDAGGQECGQSTTLHIICFTWSWLGRKGCWEVQDGFLPAPGWWCWWLAGNLGWGCAVLTWPSLSGGLSSSQPGAILPKRISSGRKRVNTLNGFRLGLESYQYMAWLLYSQDYILLVKASGQSQPSYQPTFKGKRNRPHLLKECASLVAQRVKNLPGMQETWVQSLDLGDPLEKELATHSSILAWRIPWTEEPSGLQSMGLQKVRHDWAADSYYFSLKK